MQAHRAKLHLGGRQQTHCEIKIDLDIISSICLDGSIMKLKNTTKVPEALLREVIRFVCPSSVTNFSIWFKNYPCGIAFCGRAYLSRNHVICRLPRYQRLANQYIGAGAVKGKGYRPWYANTYEEALIAITAHELNHLAQGKNPHLYRRTWGARGQYSEVDCDAYAIRKLREWRAIQNGATNAPLSTPIVPKVKKPTPLTKRRMAESLAVQYGIQIDNDRWSTGNGGLLWVYPPESLCYDGEMDGDPYIEHYHETWEEALLAVQTYAAMIETKNVTIST